MVRAEPLTALVSLLGHADPEAMIDAFEARWVDLWCTSTPAQLSALLARFPREAVRTHPGACWVAVDVGLIDGPDAARLVDRAKSQAMDDYDCGRSAVDARLLGASVHRRAGDLGSARLELQAALQIAQSDGAATPRSLAAFCHVQYGLVSLLVGDVLAARWSLRTAIDLAGTGQSGGVRRLASALLALVCAVGGELNAAAEVTDEYPRVSDGRRQVGLANDAARLTRLILLLDRWDLVAAERLVRGRPPAAYDVLWPIALWVHAQYLLLTGRHAQGQRLVELAASSASNGSGSGLGREVIQSVRADLNTISGRLREAWLATEPGRARGTWMTLSEITALYVCGEFEAVRYAARVARAAHDLPVREQVRLRGLEAAAALASGDRVAAAGLVRGIEESVRRHGWHTTSASLPQPVLDAVLASGGTERDLPSAVTDVRSWVPEPVVAAPLSPRERAVMTSLLVGVSRQEIADDLGVSINTVKTQIRSLYTKLGVGSRSELVRKVALMPPAWTYELTD